MANTSRFLFNIIMKTYEKGKRLLN